MRPTILLSLLGVLPLVLGACGETRTERGLSGAGIGAAGGAAAGEVVGDSPLGGAAVGGAAGAATGVLTADDEEDNGIQEAGDDD